MPDTPTDALFTVDPAARRIRGLVLPFGELSQPNVSGTEPVMFSAGTVALPADPSVVSLSDDHPSGESLIPENLGRAVALEETEAGIVAEFEIARTPSGDALLARATDPAQPKPRLSAELRGLVRRGAQAVAAALRGVAVVPRGAFESAAMFAALDAITEAPAPASVPAPALSLTEALERIVDERLDGIRSALQTPTTPTTQTTGEAPAPSDSPEGTEPEATTQEDDMPEAAVVPAGLAPAAPKNTDTTSADGLFAALVASKMGAPEALKPYAGGDALFAISTLQHSGPSSVTIGADVQQPRYLGELWERQPYARRYVPLLAHDTLTSYKAVGWKWDYDNDKAPKVGDYTGNTAEVPSNALDTIQVTVDASRIAGGHKLDRRYIDFNDQAIIAAYFREMTASVARQTDAKALAAIMAAATALDVTDLDAPSTSTDAVAPGLVAVVDAALQVITTENRPAYGLVSPELWREIILRPKDATLEYLRAAFGLEDGEVANFRLQPASVGTGKVIVGAKEAITFYELGGTAPIRVEGIDPHHGAIDPAVFAYWAALTNNAKAVVSVDVATYGTAE